jgi:hypothetical protein
MGRRFTILSLLALAALVASARGAASAEQIRGRSYMLGEGADAVRVIEVWGTPYQMGYAHGCLVRGELKPYYETFFRLVKPEMKATDADLDRAWQVMSRHIAPEFKEEMRGLAAGAKVPERWVHWMHIIPDLSWIQCSYFAAWGKAVADRHMYQIRALDYWMEQHVQDQPAIIMWRPNKGHPFATAGWIGFIGVCSGMNAARIAISEIGDGFGDDQKQLDAEPWIFMARRVLQYTDNLDDAIAVVRNSRRPSSYDYLIGDGELRLARQMTTGKTRFKLYDWANPPTAGGPLAQVVYTSMAVGEAKWNQTLHDLLAAHYGRINARASMEIMRQLKSGDLHAVVFDLTDLKMWVANAEGPHCPAFQRPFVMYDLAAALRKPARRVFALCTSGVK